MDYNAIFRKKIENLKQEGNYRIFADLERYQGSFPRARNYSGNTERDVTVWCSNDYLGMGQNETVIKSIWNQKNIDTNNTVWNTKDTEASSIWGNEEDVEELSLN